MDEIKWNDQYDDPDAKIILISNDNVGFRVHVWTFKKKRCVLDWTTADPSSGFIKGLLDVPSHQSLESAPIYLDYPSDTILSFVRQLHITGHPDSHLVIGLTSDICKHLFDLCDRFDAPQINDIVSKAIRMRLRMLSPTNPALTAIVSLDVWEIFRIGAARNDFEVARAAIAALDIAGLTEEILFAKEVKLSARFDGLPLRYVYPLLMLRYRETKAYPGPRPGSTFEVLWTKRDSKAIAALYEVA
jgi:hypothetical protein